MCHELPSEGPISSRWIFEPEGVSLLAQLDTVTAGAPLPTGPSAKLIPKTIMVRREAVGI